MGDLLGKNVGMVFAYVLPGFLLLCAAGQYSSTIGFWVLAPGGQGPTMAGFLYMILASMGVGMVASAVRWFILDTIHHHTGVKRVTWDDSKLSMHLSAFEYIVESHYRYYQFYGNMLVILPLVYAALRFSPTATFPLGEWSDIGVTVLCLVLFAGSRDALQKYYGRSSSVIGQIAHKDSAMTNGNHPKGKNVTKKPAQTGPETEAPKAARGADGEKKPTGSSGKAAK